MIGVGLVLLTLDFCFQKNVIDDVDADSVLALFSIKLHLFGSALPDCASCLALQSFKKSACGRWVNTGVQKSKFTKLPKFILKNGITESLNYENLSQSKELPKYENSLQKRITELRKFSNHSEKRITELNKLPTERV